ncbi:hypothetical protein J5868_02500 [Candidatus Saccharibacteria bacterium]|nr:hypothetical protein [Candidatus Saccharibacteria bacterium]
MSTLSKFNMFEREPIMWEKIGESMVRIFFEPAMYSIGYHDLLELVDKNAEQTAQSVRVISNENDYNFGVVEVECHLVRQFEEGILEDLTTEIMNFMKAHPSLRATV